MRVHILGGGIGGMSCALHLGRLARAGRLGEALEIHIYEKSARFGGKAASQIGTRDGEAGPAWPGEHGFRFFPNFYRCIVDTLSHITLSEAHVARRGLRRSLTGATVRQLLTPSREAGIGIGTLHRVPRSQSLGDLPRTIRTVLRAFPVEPFDVVNFSAAMTRFLLTCHQRALATYEHQTLEDFVRDNGLSPKMVRFLNSLRALSAMRADQGSLRTLLFTALQMFADFDPDYELFDALLPGPTDYLMIEPWIEKLIELGVVLHTDHALAGVEFRTRALGLPPSVSRVTLLAEGVEKVLEAKEDDVFVLAVPFEIAHRLLRDTPNLPKTLEGVRHIPQRDDNLGLGAEPMVGIQYWLRRDVPMVRGHVVYPLVPWAMTSVSQAQFWSTTFERPLSASFGVSGLEGILSVIVSAWDTPGYRCAAPKDVTDPEVLAREALHQITTASGQAIQWSDVLGYSVDWDVEFRPDGAHCTTPLWVSPKGSYRHRPKPDLECGNLFVASDWARTETDVGSMESADEAARWAVRGIARQLPIPPRANVLPDVRPLKLWDVVEVGRAVDAWLFDNGLPHVLDMPKGERRALLGHLRGTRGWSEKSILQSTQPHVALHEPALHMDAGDTNDLDRVLRMLEAVDAADWDIRESDLDALISELSVLS